MSQTSRRMGGRESRKALRAKPLDEATKPIRPGISGGRYKVLTDENILMIHEKILVCLEKIGLANATKGCIEYCTKVGAIYGDDKRLRFPRSLIEDTIANAARNFPLYAQNPKHDINLSGKNVHFGTAGAATQVIDLVSRKYRDATTQDLYDAARLVDKLDNIHFFQRPLTVCDVDDMDSLDMHTAYASAMGTSKHIGVSFNTARGAQKTLNMLFEIAGGEKKWRERPFASNTNCFVVPPLRFAEDSCDVLEVVVKAGMPILLLSAGQAGATAPAALAGAIVQAVAETLAGLVYVNAVVPGAQAIMGTWPFVSDLRTGSMSAGSAEQGLLSAACTQMVQHYDLPTGAPAGMTDAKLPDIQAGYERGTTALAAGLAGCNMVYEAAGMQASLLGFCLESLIVDNDMLGQCLRLLRGIEVDESTLSLDTMEQVCMHGPGHYLGHEQTLGLMQSEYVYPNFCERFSPKEWAEFGKPELMNTILEEKNKILKEGVSSHFNEELYQNLMTKYNLKPLKHT